MDALRIIARVEGETLEITGLGRFEGRKVELIVLPLDEEGAGEPGPARAKRAPLGRAARGGRGGFPEYGER